MSWSSFLRASACIVVLGLLAACGFKPLYSRDSGVPAALDTVQLPFMPEREGQMLRNHLAARFNPDGRHSAIRYKLEIKLTTSRVALGIRKDETATRANLVITAHMVLRDSKTNKILFRGTAISANSYNILDSRFATVISEQDAMKRATRELADNIKNRIAIFLVDRGSAG